MVTCAGQGQQLVRHTSVVHLEPLADAECSCIASNCVPMCSVAALSILRRVVQCKVRCPVSTGLIPRAYSLRWRTLPDRARHIPPSSSSLSVPTLAPAVQSAAPRRPARGWRSRAEPEWPPHGGIGTASRCAMAACRAAVHTRAAPCPPLKTCALAGRAKRAGHLTAATACHAWRPPSPVSAPAEPP